MIHFKLQKGVCTGCKKLLLKIQNAVQDFTAKFDHWNEMLETTNTAASPQFSSLTNELKQTYKDIKKALKEMEKSIEYVQKNPQLGVSSQEIARRTEFVKSMMQTIDDCRQKILSDRTKQTLDKHKKEMHERSQETPNQRASRVATQDIINAHQQQTQAHRQEQDEILDDMLETLKRLGVKGHDITAEIEEQNVMLDEVSTQMDTASDRIAHLTHKLDALMNHSESKKICIIIVLIIILGVMIYFMF
ncbi:expressed hypothetical protein [Reticulomyxa filosa]|uniref:t-SNARE coiled-coil homology domain-containing protein n=1 Tax=Reticulomyxa filosa TaxID=46433 RepID=X6NRW4_RETFI|nr:expressed hypothetical protein [Reticulomyxa filosa]|eukprot:ETO28444.1 expressed hypothetical protein [Reticulomyxa filosa]